MAREINRLSSRFVATTKEPGRHADGGGLYLIVKPTGARAWAFIFKKDGRWREMGLGALDTVSLARARDLAADARTVLGSGGDPIEARRKAAAAEPKAAIPTFAEAAKEYVDAMAAGWRNPKHADQWRTTLGIVAAKPERLRIDVKAQNAHLDALKRLRAQAVDEIETAHVLAVLKPIWQLKNETAARLRGRIEAVLDAAAAQGYRSELNPARWRGHLDKLLTKRAKLARGHHKAMPYGDLPAFVEKLIGVGSVSANAMAFAILTAARSGEVMGATWAEMEITGKVWTVPAARMKSGREHRVPLTAPALAILDKMREIATGDFVFPGSRLKKGLSVMALAMALRRLETDATPHGFRSSFRDWAGEETSFPREVAEAALAHVVGDETERAYRRGDALEKRRKLMEAWAGFIAPSVEPKVIPIARKFSKRAA